MLWNLKALMPVLYTIIAYLLIIITNVPRNYVPVCMSVIRGYLYMLLFTLKNAHLLSSYI